MINILLLRLTLGWIFVYEGAGKLFGWFGGSGIEAVTGYFEKLGIIFPSFSAYLVGYAEFLAGFCLLAGYLVRFASGVIVIIMAVAILTAHRQGGFNYPLLILVVCAFLVEYGAGKFSLDAYVAKLKKKR